MHDTMKRRACALKIALTKNTAAQCQCRRCWCSCSHNVRKTSALTNFNCHKVFGDLFIVNEVTENFRIYSTTIGPSVGWSHCVYCKCEFHSWQFAFIHSVDDVLRELWNNASIYRVQQNVMIKQPLCYGRGQTKDTVSLSTRNALQWLKFKDHCNAVWSILHKLRCHRNSIYAFAARAFTSRSTRSEVVFYKIIFEIIFKYFTLHLLVHNAHALRDETQFSF